MHVGRAAADVQPDDVSPVTGLRHDVASDICQEREAAPAGRQARLPGLDQPGARVRPAAEPRYVISGPGWVAMGVEVDRWSLFATAAVADICIHPPPWSWDSGQYSTPARAASRELTRPALFIH